VACRSNSSNSRCASSGVSVPGLTRFVAADRAAEGWSGEDANEDSALLVVAAAVVVVKLEERRRRDNLAAATAVVRSSERRKEVM
jgi:hypothetical protein